MVSLSGDGLRATTRNIIFLSTTAIILGCFYGLYFELNKTVQKEPLYLSLVIVASVLFAIFFTIIIVDSFRNRDLKLEQGFENERNIEHNNLKGRLPLTSQELEKRAIGRDKIYYNNAFETTGNIWRTFVFALIAISIFTCVGITYAKHPSDKKDDLGYILALVIASLAMAVHVGFLIYQLYERSKIVKEDTITTITKSQRGDEETRKRIENERDEEII